MIGRGRMLGIGLVLLTCVATEARAQSESQPMIVGTKEAPPFAMKGPAGHWTGLSIELWQDIATKLGLKYEFREAELDQLLAGIADNSMGAAVAAITVTSDREQASPPPPVGAHRGRPFCDGSSPSSFSPSSACWR
jgi:ABC-type amino acid transport substrate-binding protein